MVATVIQKGMKVFHVMSHGKYVEAVATSDSSGNGVNIRFSDGSTAYVSKSEVFTTHASASTAAKQKSLTKKPAAPVFIRTPK